MSKYSILLVAMIILFESCEKDSIYSNDVYIDSNLEVYFELFANEGLSRGVNIDYSVQRIEGYIENITGNIAGECHHDSAFPSKIIVDRQYWNRATTTEREFLVFHELGHCYLNREHLDTQNADGSCASIMHSGLTNCINAYSPSTRERYLDELFSHQ
jgi:hypothetical protein